MQKYTIDPELLVTSLKLSQVNVGDVAVTWNGKVGLAFSVRSERKNVEDSGSIFPL